MLTTESHIRMLEAMVDGLRSSSAAAAPFRLAGSLQSDLSDEELEAALARSKAARRSAEEAKLQDLLER